MPEKTPLALDKTLLFVFGAFTLIFIALDRIAGYFVPADPTTGYLAAAIFTLVVLVFLEILVFKRNLRTSLYFLGFGRPHTRTVFLTLLAGAVMLLFFPIFSFLTGATVSLPDHWLWKLTGIVALHGMAEELLFRGFLFHHFRENRSFDQAAYLSLGAFAVAHLYLFTYMPAPVALFASLLALASAMLFAYLFEQGNNTVWAPAILHILIHMISFFEVSDPHAITAGISWMSIWMLMLLVAYAFRKQLFESH